MSRLGFDGTSQSGSRNIRSRKPLNGIWGEPIRFSIPGRVQPKQRPRASVVGRIARIYTPSRTLKYESLVASCVPPVPVPGPAVRIVLRIVLPRPKTKPKWVPKVLWEQSEPYHRGSCDIDNCIKSILDGCGEWLGNDRAVVEVQATKVCGDNPRVDVEVYGLRISG